jgi:hypothetical protein
MWTFDNTDHHHTQDFGITFFKQIGFRCPLSIVSTRNSRVTVHGEYNLGETNISE